MTLEEAIKKDLNTALSELVQQAFWTGYKAATDKIVHCKDCKHRPKQNGEGKQGFNLEFPNWKCPCQCEDGWYNWMPEDDWYCGNGERKEE